MAKDIFFDYAPKYYDLGYRPFCTQGPTKIPLTKGRSFETYKLKHELNSANKDSNIGIGVGKEFKIIALDIDTPEEFHGTELEKQIEALLPTSKYCRVGRPGRKLYFFKYKDEENYASVNHNGKKWLELLTKNRFVVVPPSIHPDTKGSYYWTDGNLLDCPIDDLDYSPIDIYEAFTKIQDLLENNIKQDKHAKITSGRNDEMKKVVTAKLHEHKDISTIVRESVEYDNERNSPPLFSDPTEFRGETNAEINAFFFVSNIYKSMGKNKPKLNVNGDEVKFEIVDAPKEKKEKQIDFYKRTKLPEFRGISQDIFKHIYSNSPIPRTRFAAASTLATMGTALSNRYDCLGIYTNLYILITTPSGGGKDYPINAPYQIFSESDCVDLIGDSPESDSGILSNLTTKPARLDKFDEAARLFVLMNDSKNSYGSKMADVYAELYSSPGRFYSGKTLKDKTHGKCFSPCVSIIGALTIDDFRKNFNTDLISKGIGARFLFFPDTEFKDVVKVKKQTINSDIIEFIKNARTIKQNKSLNFQKNVESFSLKVTEEVENRFISATNDFRKLGLKKDSLAPIYNRMGENMMKLAIIDSVSVDRTSLTMDSLDWAYSWISAQTNSIDLFFEENMLGSKFAMINSVFESAIREAGLIGMARSDIISFPSIKKFGLRKAEISEQLDLLRESKKVFFDKIGNIGRKKEIYYHVEFYHELKKSQK